MKAYQPSAEMMLCHVGGRIFQKTTLFTILGAAFSAGDCTAHSLRGKRMSEDSCETNLVMQKKILEVESARVCHRPSPISSKWTPNLVCPCPLMLSSSMD